MSAFEAGALVWKIQTVGAEIFRRDQKDAQEAFDKTGEAAAKAGKKVSESGTATDKASESARKTKKPLDEQAEATRKAAEEAAKAERAAKEHAAALEKQRAAAQQLANVMMLAGAAVAAMVTLAVVKHSEFDQAMSNTSAAIMATREEQELLAESALQAGADTAYSATEAAAAQEELAKAGMSVSNVIKGGLNGALSLAAAGQLAVARSAEIMATTLTQFQLPASKAAHVADLLAAGAGKAQGSVEDMGLALSYVGPLANSVGWSIEETAGTIAYFATQGIIGEKAGTALRGVMAGLQAPSAAAQKVMDQYGITVYDASGKMKSASGLAEEFKTKLGGLTDQERQAAMGRIFGNESLLAATLLYQGGAEAIDEWTGNVNDAGYAAEQAAMRQDNLAGDIEKLGGSFETVLIKQGEGANDVLRQMVQAITEAVDVFGEMPDPLQAMSLGLGAAAAAGLLAAGAVVTTRTRFIELKKALDDTSISFNKTALVGAAAGIALTGIIMIVGSLMAAHAEARAKAEAYADTLEEGTQRITKETQNAVAAALAMKQSFLWMEQDSTFDAAEKLGISLELVQKAAVGDSEAIKQLDKDLSPFLEKTYDNYGNLVNVHGELAGSAEKVRDGVKGEADSLEQAALMAKQKEDALNRSATADEEAAAAAQTAADKFLEQADATKAVEDRLRELIDALMESNNRAQDAESANARYQDALAGISEEIQSQRDAYEEANWTLDGFTASLDANTVTGSANRAMLADVAGAAQDVAQKQYEVDLTTMSAEDAAKKYNATLDTQRAKLIEQAEAAGFSKTEVDELVTSVFAIPPAKSLEILVDTRTAEERLQSFKNTLNSIPSYKGVSVETIVGNPSMGYVQADGGHVEFYANGGHRWENRIAQHAKAGDYRIWAEPETGGETYIPHAMSKRARSTQILGETADMFGYMLVPKGASQFADGSAVGSGALGVSAPVTVSLAGATFVAEIDGKPIKMIIREQVTGMMPSAGAWISHFGGR